MHNPTSYDFHLDIDDPENFPDVTDEDATFVPEHEPEDYDLDTRSFSKWSEADFAYDLLSRKGYE
jgi:hypothetical protein